MQKAFSKIYILVIIIVIIAAGVLVYQQLQQPTEQTQPPTGEELTPADEQPPVEGVEPSIEEENLLPEIEVIVPNGGEEWVIGNTYTIKWKSSNVEKVDISLPDYRAPEKCLLNQEPISASSGEYTFELTTCTAYPGMGSSAEVQIAPGDKYMIQIFSAEDFQEAHDRSDNYFTIEE